MITADVAAAVRAAVLKAAEDVAATHNVEISDSRATFNGGHLRIQVTLIAYDEYGQRGDAREKFDNAAPALGFKPRHYGMQFSANGERYRIVKATRDGFVTCVGENGTVNMSAGQVLLALREQGLDD